MSGDTTERRFFSSTVASYASLLVRLAVSFAARMILARLVLPEGHGLYELALRIVILVSAVRDLGLPYHLMRDRGRPYGTVMAFTLVTGAVLAGLVALASPLSTAIDPELPPVLAAFAVWVFLDGLVQVPKTYFERELRISRMVAPEILRGLTVAAVAVGLAWAGWGVWSLVLGDLAAAAVFAAMVWARAWKRMPIEVRPRLLPGLLRQSWLLFAIWGVLQLVTYVDLFIVSAHASTGTVGQYARAYMVAFLVPLIVAPRALLPALVEYRDDEERFLASFRVGTVFLMFFQITAGYFLFLNAERVVAILLGERWDAAVPLLKVLCFVPFLDVFTDLGGEVLKVRQEDRWWLAIMLVNLVSLVTAGVLLTREMGALGMAFANFFLLGNLLMAWRMRRVFGAGFRRLMVDLAFLYLLPLPLFAAAGLLPSGSWPRFFASFAAFVVSAVVLAPRFYPLFDGFFRARRAG